MRDNIFLQRTTDEINNTTDDVINQFAIKGKYRLIGSNSLRSIIYGSDYDVETQVQGYSIETIVKRIKEEYREARKNPDVWILELKCGHDPRLIYNGDYSKRSLEEYVKNPLIPNKMATSILNAKGEEQIEMVRDLFILRWKPKDVEAGKIKLIDGTTRSLAECLLDKTICKVDLIAKVGNQFAEISENYYIKADGKANYNTQPSAKDLMDSLEEDIRYYSNTDSMKSLKRLFSLYLLEGKQKHRKQLERMIDFFNGQIGYLNKIKNELGILENLLKQDFRKPKWKDVEENLQFIKEQISAIYKVSLGEDVFRQIDKITEKSALKDIASIKDYFSTKINKEAKDFLRLFI